MEWFTGVSFGMAIGSSGVSPRHRKAVQDLITMTRHCTQRKRGGRNGDPRPRTRFVFDDLQLIEGQSASFWQFWDCLTVLHVHTRTNISKYDNGVR